MSIKFKLNLLNKLFLFMFVFLLSSAVSFAAVNSLSGIDVKQIGTSDYNVILKLDKGANINKVSVEEGTLTLVLNSAIPSDSVEIVYDNAVDLENVIVQKKNNESTVILLQGKNIENARIFTKDLSTGITKENNPKSNALINYFFTADKKITGLSVVAMLIIFGLMLSLRPKNKRYSSSQVSMKKSGTVKKVTLNTLRNKNAVQSGKIPSINYNVNGSAKSLMSVPKDFVINNYQVSDDEQIRKAG